MARLVKFLFVALYYQILVNLPSALVNAQHLCRSDQSFLLLQFKQTFDIVETASVVCDSQGQSSYPKMMSWNRSTDCCRSWDGVKCDKLTGHVIGLDLSCSQLQGVIDSNSSLFQLSHLQRLNLAYNDLFTSHIPSKFGRLSSLTHLNLAFSSISGDLPRELLRLSNLISLDLSSSLQYSVKMRPDIFKMLLQNFTELREVLLSGIDIASVFPSHISSSIKILELGGTNLRGILPGDIFRLPKLHTLLLYDNSELSGHLPEVRWNCSDTLRYLDLSGTSFSGKVPESIGHLKALNSLYLDSCNFSGSLPQSLGNLTQLKTFDLSNNNLGGQVPSTLANLAQLKIFDLSKNSLGGPVPDYFSNFRNMKTSALRNNESLTGPIPSVYGYQNLEVLNLSKNRLNGTIPPWVFSLPSLRQLHLQSNQFTGKVSDFQYHLLEEIDLSVNMLQGTVPESISNLVNLTTFFIDSNNFIGDIKVSMFSNMNQLMFLDLSDNTLSLASGEAMNSTLPLSLGNLRLSNCGVKDSEFLIGARNLLVLDLSRNMLHGQIFSDRKWYKWGEQLFSLNLSHNFLTDIHQLPFQNLQFLDLRFNLLQGPLFIPPVTISLFFTSNNNLTGEIPLSICNLSSPYILDLSKNNLSGLVPQCLGNMSKELSVLDLHMNHFHGNIDATFPVGCNLRSLNLRNNQIQGTVPKSLSNCKELEVLDIGNNNLSGAFPKWLGTLPKLQVLSLRSNNLHGTISTSRTPNPSFTALRILDLSSNNFTGSLPTKVFKNLRGMMRTNEAATTTRPLAYIGDVDIGYDDSVMVIVKGQEIQLVRILSIFTTIDLSLNNFQGQIPNVIGNLISLRGLNLSHNSLGGQIPRALGNLRVLESLDLSSNQLEGEIPRQLAALSYLSVLNLSHNQLVGSIPRGRQFDTFENGSYIGNIGLCGFPLSKSCGTKQLPPPPPPPPPAELDQEDDDEFFSGFTWKAVLMGYACGMVIGMIMGCVIFIIGKPKWFNKIVQEEGSKLVRNKWPKYVKWL